jgi:Xaa-Pro dipeptidase
MKSRSERLKERLAVEGLAALVSLSPENVYYSTGAFIKTQRYLRDRLAIAVFSDSRDDSFIVCSLEEDGVREQSWINDIRTYTEFQESPVALLVDALKERGLERSRIGIEMHYLTARYYQPLVAALPGASFVECQHVFDRTRMIKEPKEIEILVDAARKTEKAASAAFMVARAGDSEFALSNEMVVNLMKMGMNELSFMFLGTGRRSALLHPIPSPEVRLAPGDLIRVDFGGLFSGYFSDLARMAVVEKPAPVHASVYQKLARVQGEVVTKLKLGMTFADIYNNCGKAFEQMGLPFKMPHAGHGLGLECHEYPMISPVSHEVLQTDMIFNVEFVLFLEDWIYQVENMVHMTQDGPRVVTGLESGDRMQVVY